MKAQTWVLVRQLFEQAIELSGKERPALLDRSCDGQPEIRQEVERLLAEDESSGDFLERRIVPHLMAEGDLPPGTRIGQYTLRRLLASGGMGTVFEATQDRPRRTVALKTLRFGPPSPARLRRFQFEAEVLGTLRHPGIAQIYEAGAHEGAGGTLPFFAMEFVADAKDILSYARDRGLSRDARLRLFLSVCDAVSHGHQKGVIHRDLKPGNLLVDGEGRAKVIDFGVARATGAHVPGLAVETRAGQIVGTLQYMSPEQLEGQQDDVDVRSDVYALGCVLYELLTGEPPYALDELSIGAVLRTIKETQPRRPADLPVELGWILFKALEKDAALRYPSVGELAADLVRFRANEPVLAGPPSGSYRLRKLVQRHRAGIAAVGAVIIALSVGLVQSRIDARAAERARISAELEATKARGVAQFLRRTLTSVAPYEMGRDVRMVDVLDEASRMVSTDLSDEPEVRAVVQQAIGDSYRASGQFAAAEAHLSAAYEFVGGHVADDDPFSIEVGASMANLLLDQVRYAESAELTEVLLPLAERRLGPDNETTIDLRYLRARALNDLGRANEAEPLAEANLEIRRRIYGEGHERLMRPLRTLAKIRSRLGDYEQQLTLLEEAAAICAERLPDDHYQNAIARIKLGLALFELTRWEEAEANLRPSLDWVRRELGDEHFQTLEVLNNLSIALMMQGRTDEAIPLIEEAIPLSRKLYGDKSPNTVRILNNLAVSYQKREMNEEAETVCYEALELADGILPEDHDLVLRVRLNLGKALEGQGRLDEAEDVFLPTWEMSREAVGAEHAVTLAHLARLVWVQELSGDWEELELYATELLARDHEVQRYQDWSQEMIDEARAALPSADR